ncbi:MAG: hypothetical protein ACHQX3_06755, partial [Nitrospirales bacterium]
MDHHATNGTIESGNAAAVTNNDDVHPIIDRDDNNVDQEPSSNSNDDTIVNTHGQHSGTDHASTPGLTNPPPQGPAHAATPAHTGQRDRHPPDTDRSMANFSPFMGRPNNLHFAAGMFSTPTNPGMLPAASHMNTSSANDSNVDVHGHFPQIRLPQPFPSHERLKGVENYAIWRDRLENKLRQSNLYDFIQGYDSCPSSRDGACSCYRPTSFYHVTASAALGFIKDQLTDEVLRGALQLQTPATLLRHLDSEFGSGNPQQREVRSLQLEAELMALPLPSDTSRMDAFISKVDSIAASIAQLGDTHMTDRRLALLVGQKFNDGTNTLNHITRHALT